jgi:RNA polymerase sigma factor (sigma-70 family)
MNAVASDERLTRRATGGDRRAFDAIFRRYHQSLYRYCLAIVGNPEDAQDALQNAMVKVLRALPGEERRIELKPWLYRIAHNESIELLRRRRVTVQLDPEQAVAGPGLAAEAEARERLRRLLGDLEELPDRQRGALVMRELGGLGFGEIGEALGTSAAVARQTVYEARLGLGQMQAGREMSCETAMRVLSDGDGRVTRRRDVRAHLRGCSSCRRFGEEIGQRQHELAALAPLPAAAAAGLLHGLFGSHAAAGGLVGGVGGGVAKTLGTSAALKAAATVAVVAAVGVTVADRGGFAGLGQPDGGDSGSARRSSSAGAPVPSRPRAVGQEVSAATRVSPRRATGKVARLQGSRRAVAGADRQPAGAAVPTPPPKPDAGPAQGLGNGPPLHHASGRGHQKQLPDAAAHGQQTAAAHKAAPHGQSGSPSQGQPTHSPGRSAEPAQAAPTPSASPPRPSEPPAPPSAPTPGAPGEAKLEAGSPPLK